MKRAYLIFALAEAYSVLVRMHPHVSNVAYCRLQYGQVRFEECVPYFIEKSIYLRPFQTPSYIAQNQFM